MNILRKLILVLIFALSLFACNSEKPVESSSITDSEVSGLVTIKGVATKGPISGATIEILQFDANDGAESGTAIATTTTDTNGDWSVTIDTNTYPNVLLIKSTGGSYLDESDPEPIAANKRTIDLSGFTLLGALFPGYSAASVNIMTHAMIEKSRIEASGSNFLNVIDNNRNIASSALGFDPFTVAAANPLSPSTSASVDAIEYAMYLGGIATALNTAAIKLGIAQPTSTVIDGFIQDISDGDLDGSNQSGTVTLDVGSGPVSFPNDIDLNNAIIRFRNNNYAAYSVTQVTQPVSVNVAVLQTSGVNNNPSAINDNYTTVEGTQVVTGDVLSNDSDPDGDSLSITANTQPASGTGSVVNNGDGTFTYSAPSGFTGNSVFNYTVDDGKGGVDSADIIITVTSAPSTGGGTNNAPIAEAGNPITVDELLSVALSGSGTDTDGSIASYLWTQIGGASVTLTNATFANASFTAPAVAAGASDSLVFQLTVTDDDNDTGSDFVTVTVNSTQTPSSNAPVANAGVDQTVNEQTGVTLDATASTDSDGTIVSYSWTQTGGSPTVSLVNANTAMASFVGPNIAADSTLTFFVIVTDNDGNSSTDSVDVTMTADPGILNDDPVAVTDNFVTPQGISLQSADLTGNDTDINGDPVILIGVTQPPLNEGVVTNNGNSTITFVPDLAFSGVSSFTYSVIDGQGGSDTGNVNITVDPDSDGDGILDSNEIAISLDPFNADTDGDGFYDGHEMLISGTAAYLSNETPPGTVISSGNSNNLISTDTTWNLANSPYWVQTDVSVQGGATLTIDSGVVVKFDNGTDIFVNASGNLIVQGNAPIPQNVRFTSIFDDSLNGDTGNVVGTPGANNWGGIDFQTNSAGSIEHASVRYAGDCFYINNSSPGLNNVEVGDCGGFGIHTYSTSGSMTSSLHNITITDFDNNNQGTGLSGIYLEAANATTNTLDISNLNLDDAGGTSSYGIYVRATSTSNIPGIIDNVTITDVGSHAVYLRNDGTGLINPAISNVSIPSPGSGIGLYIHNTSTGTLSPVFDGSNSIDNISNTVAAIQVFDSTPDFLDSGSWTLNNVGYGMYLSNAGGNFNNIAIDNTAIAGVLLANGSDPFVFSDITLTNAATPYELVGQNITTAISTGYDYSDVSVSKSYIRLNGTLLADMTLGPDPLNNAGNSVWRVTANLTVPAGITLTVEDGAIIKFEAGRILYVDGNMIIGDGDGLGSNAVLTSILDDSVGGDTNGDSTATSPSWNDWNSIRPRTGSTVNIDNATIGYSSYGIYHYNVQSTSLDISNTDFHDVNYYGIQIGLFSSQTLTMNLDTVSFTDTGVNTNYHGIYANVDTSASLSGSWDNVTLNDIGGSGIYIDDSSTAAVDPTISGLTIGNSGTVGVHGVQLIGNSSTAPIFNGTAGNNVITGGGYNLTLQGAGGSYSDLTLSGATTSALNFSGTANPTAWDDASIILSNTPTPYILLVDLPTSVGVLGTTDLGYNVGSSSFTSNYVAIGSSLSNITLVENPLNLSGVGSVYRVISNITVPAGTTLTIEDGAVLKFNTGLTLYVDGSLIVGGGDGDGVGTNAVFTSIRDDSIGGDTNGDTTTTTAAWNDWNSIRPRTGSTVNIDNATIGYSSYGIYHNNVQSTGLDITFTDFHDVYYYGIELGLFSSQTLTMNLDTVSFTDTGVNTNYHGIYANVDTSASLSGSWDNVTLNDIGGSGIYIDDSSTAAVDPTISGLTVADIGTVGVNGVQLIGSATTTLTFDNSSGNANFIGDGSYNLTLQGVGGSYDNLTLDGASTSSIYISNDSTAIFPDGNNIILTNSPSPYTLISMNIPAGVSYNTASSSFTDNYVILRGPITSDLTLSADPLNTATGTGQADDPTVSYWYSPFTLTINNGITLDIQADTLMKFAETRYLEVASGAMLNINGTSGNEVYLTSFSDNAVGDPVTSAAVNNDWYGVYFRAGSEGGTINSLSTWYAYYGVYFQNATTSPVFNDLEIQYPYFGLYFTATTAIDPSFSNTFINQANQESIYFTSSGNIAPTFSGINSIFSSISGGDDCIYNNSSSPNILISGWTIDGCSNGIDTRQAGTYTNNLIRNASAAGMYINTTSAITVGGNTIVNNGTYNSTYGGGIEVRNIGAASIIENNLIRQNEGYRGGGMYFDGGSINTTVRNNLIVENRVSNNGGGVYILDSTAMSFLNNTIADNTVAGASKIGIGLYIGSLANAVTYLDNIIANNSDDDSVENIEDLSAGSVENFNLEDASSTNGLTGANSQINAIPDFTQGWYLGALTDAVDAGSDLPGNLGLTGTTTQADGTVDASTVDLGYHYVSGSTVVSAGNSTVITPTVMPVNFNVVVTYTVTPRDTSGTPAIIGAGLDVQISAANFPGSLGSVLDLGDGTYRFTYTAGTTDQDDTLTITVNGVALNTQPFIDWP